MMKMMKCRDCGRDRWHNSIPAKVKGGELGWRCTFCGSPLGTGPKADRNRDLNRRQISKRI